MNAALLTGDLRVDVAQVLSGAADYLGSYGLHQGDYYDDGTKTHPACCALGALGMVVYGQVVDTPSLTELDRSDLFTAAREHLREFLVTRMNVDPITEGDGWDGTVAAWSDHPNQTATSVAHGLRAAADCALLHGLYAVSCPDLPWAALRSGDVE